MSVRSSSGVTVRGADPADAMTIGRIDGLSASSVALLDHDLSSPDRCCLVAVTGDDVEVAGGIEVGGDVEVAGGIEVAGDIEVAGGEVVGYAAAIVQVGEAQVIDLAVAPPCRTRGIGGQLLDALLVEVAARGAGPVTLEVATANGPAQALYRRRGFVVEGRRPRYYPDGTDALIMWRRPGEAGEPAVAATSTSLSARRDAEPTLEREDD